MRNETPEKEKTMDGEVQVSMILRNTTTYEERTVYRRFHKSEDAWGFVIDTKLSAERRRSKADREMVVRAFSYGITATGKTYGNMLYINGQRVTPYNSEGLKSSPYSREHFNDLETKISFLSMHYGMQAEHASIREHAEANSK